ncbi:MAG: QueT transporter family protein [Clostridia bacterium]|nr:QueT transporter family protein [Clostridia bacterium]
MNNTQKSLRFVATGAMIAALYAGLTYAQSFILPGSATMAVQFRVSEALNVLALFTPAAIPGLTIGCVIANIYSIGSGLPLDMIFGSLATLGATACMWFLRNAKVGKYPLFAMIMPALWNGVIVGWEIEKFFIEGPFTMTGFFTQGGFVALGEFAVMFTLGTALCFVMIKRGLDRKLFGADEKKDK